MPSRWDDEDDAEYDEYDDDIDTEDDEEPMVPCPYCRREIHEEAEQCPYCEQYISAVDSPPSKKPWWLLIGVVVCLYIIYRWSVG
ncbi:MAG: hypothetical protein SGJ19_14340 [Planctomycetia bacterium]|nr:hypothetical protein [Planctomycetia bacterium]